MSDDNEKNVEAEKKFKCIFGNVVKIQNRTTKVTSTYELVPQNKESLDRKKISLYSALGSAIWGKEEGTVVTVKELGKEDTDYKIISVGPAG
ncbi:MAG: GreA/GreB family elongation factor [bacterium]|nr:GreA/GreB family elongation factor [bacterium]MBU1916590.1 GreA/GreB family elongation factor [bacterium]